MRDDRSAFPLGASSPSMLIQPSRCALVYLRYEAWARLPHASLKRGARERSPARRMWPSVRT